jgi:hypothetical protein
MGYNFSNRFPQIVAALTVRPVRSCLIDGEAVVCNESGLAVFATDATGQALAYVYFEEEPRRRPVSNRR